MRVVFPGVPDTAECLDAVVGRFDRGVERHDGGHTGGELAFVAGRHPRGVPHRRFRLLGGGQHPSAPVLDRLELSDRSAELMPDLGVLGRGFHCPACYAAGFGAKQDRRQASDRLAVHVHEHAVGWYPDAVGPDLSQWPGQIDAADGGDVEVGRVDSHPALTLSQVDGRDDQIGDSPCQHRAAGSAHHHGAIGFGLAREARRERDGSGQRSVSELGDEVRGRAAGRCQHGRREHRRQEGTRQEGEAKLGCHHRKFGQAKPLATIRLRQMQAKQTLIG